MSSGTSYGFIYNPIAGHGHSKNIYIAVANHLKSKGLPFSIHTTKGPSHATTLAAQLLREHDVVVAIGGDGTINEVVSGLVGSNATLGIIPIGSGNDLNKIIGMPKNVEAALECLINGKKRLIDVGVAKFTESNSDTGKERYFINSLGVGIDAEIALETKQIKRLTGLALYLYAAIKVLMRYRTKEMTISSDGWSKSGRTYLVCIGNGNFEGGGFRLLPGAKPDDGMLDICIIPRMSVMSAFPLIPKIIAGTHINDHRIVSGQVDNVELNSCEELCVHADGEILGKTIKSLKVSVLKNKLQIVYPSN